MADKVKMGFTIIELLVVITILALLAAILIPAVQSAREASRRAACMNNQRNIARALIEYQTAKKRFPMGLNIVPLRQTNKSTVRYRDQRYLLDQPFTMVAWQVMIFPNMEQLSLWDNLTQAVDNTTDESIRKPLNILLSSYWCPSAGTQQACQISYVANAGYNDMPWGVRNTDTGINGWNIAVDNLVGDRTKFEGMFQDGKDPNQGEPLKYDDIKDGLANTMMISENLQFNDVWTNMENLYGFCWPYYNNNDQNWHFNDEHVCTDLAGYRVYVPPQNNISRQDFNRNFGYGFQQTPMRINRCGLDIIGSRAWLTARPSSAHPHIVIAAMADGSVRPINQELDMLVYAAAMTPRDSESVCTPLRNRMFQSAELD